MKKKELFYSKKQIKFQKRFYGDKVANALKKNRVYKKLEEKHKKLIKNSNFFIIASTNKNHIDCSIKCGLPGFVNILGKNLVEWQDYDGNRMYRTLGNISENNKVTLLFIDLEKPEKKEVPDYPTKLRILGNAKIIIRKNKVFIRVKISFVFPNCPRYLPNYKFISPSTYLLKKKVPQWKKRNYIKEIL